MYIDPLNEPEQMIPQHQCILPQGIHVEADLEDLPKMSSSG